MLDALIKLAILIPTIVVVSLVKSHMSTSGPTRKLELGVLLFCLALMPGVVLFSIVPGGAFSDLEPSLSLSVDAIFYAAFAPIGGALILSISLIFGGLWQRRVERRRYYSSLESGEAAQPEISSDNPR